MEMYSGRAVKVISKDSATCMRTDEHQSHWWAYTSEGGGHMAAFGYPEWYSDYREWLCPGTSHQPPRHMLGRTI